ncbi:MAG: hypothetical protein JXR63_05060 [Spirochaetales bacterium]|nr:hypothetical protein [Spirochaetales bacterium]
MFSSCVFLSGCDLLCSLVDLTAQGIILGIKMSQMHTNALAGYSVKFPDNWELYTKIELYDPELDAYAYRIKSENEASFKAICFKGYTLDYVSGEFESELKKDGIIYTKEDITVNKRDAREYTYFYVSEGVEYYTKRILIANRRKYVIGMAFWTTKESYENSEINVKTEFDAIVESINLF